MEYTDDIQPAPDLSQPQNGLSGFINPQQAQAMAQRQAMVNALRGNQQQQTSGSNMQKGASDFGKGLGGMLGGGGMMGGFGL